MADMRIEKLLDELPQSIIPNTTYYVKSNGGFDMWISDNLGQNVYKLNDGIDGLSSSDYDKLQLLFQQHNL